MKIYIGKSKLHGKGIFALRDIEKGEIILIVKGKEVNFFITDFKKALKVSSNIFGISKNKWLDPKERSWLYFNHSCDPNAGIKGHVEFVALRNIKKDEEVTFDYSLNEADIFWSMKCNCGSKNCRKSIKSIEFLPRRTFNRYISFIPKYFKEVFKKFNVSNFNNIKELQDKWLSFLKK